ncbi:hypothetical protein [Aeromonas enteropelogenes]
MNRDYDGYSSPPSGGDNQPVGGANQHQMHQWIMVEINRLTKSVGGIEASQGHHDTTMQKLDTKTDNIDSRVNQLSTVIKVGMAVIATAVTVAGFLLGNKLSEILSSLEALSKVSS